MFSHVRKIVSTKKYSDVIDSGREGIAQGLTGLKNAGDEIKTNILPRLWNGWVRPTFRLLMLVRFSILVAAVLGYVLIANPQAQEVIRGLVETPSAWPRAWFVVSAVVCAFVAWYWARVAFFFSYENIDATQQRFTSVKLERLNLSDVQIGKIRRWLDFLKEYLPRILGTAVLGVIAWGMFNALQPYETIDTGPGRLLRLSAWAFSAAAIGFFFVCPLLRRWLDLDDQDRGDDSNSIEHLWKKTWPFFLAGLFLTVGLTALFAYQAVNIAPSLGTATIGLLFAIALIPNGTFLVLFIGERWGVPVIGFAFIWLVVMSMIVDNHRVRQHAEMTSYGSFVSESAAPVSYPEFRRFQDYYNAWVAELEEGHPDGTPIPVFIISAEGGGIRAAYWTSAVLGELQGRSEGIVPGSRDFARHVFAVSGVSGGSLGAATFAGLLAARPESVSLEPQEEPREGSQDEITLTAAPTDGGRWSQDHANCILSRDFLAPTVAVMLFPDFFQRFYFDSSFNDRAIALERAWENAWVECGVSRPVFSEPFEALWEGEDPFGVPLLFLNSTVVETGQRMISSPLPLDAKYFNNAFSHAIETNRVLGHGAPLSTVVGTSARFTYVSPAGTVQRLDLDEHDTDEHRLIRVVDGGYFENSGAVTASELLSALEAAAANRSDRLRKGGGRIFPIRPVVIHISNDPLRQSAGQSVLQARAGGILPELFSPVEALVNSRPARGYQARTSLENRVEGNPLAGGAVTPKVQAVVEPGIHVHFRLCEYDIPLPLGWVLSEATRSELDAQISNGPAADDPAGRRGSAVYNQQLVSRIMLALEGNTDLSPDDWISLDDHAQCNGES